MGYRRGEYSVNDPNGFAIAVSTTEFGLNGGPNLFPAIRHAAMCEPHGEQVADFYLNVFGLEKASVGHWSATGAS